MRLTSRSLGQRVCVYNESRGWHPDNDCQAPATHHVLWHSGSMSVACPKHVRLARMLDGYVMEHEIGGVCAMPGTLWIIKANICVLDDRGDEARAAHFELLKMAA